MESWLNNCVTEAADVITTKEALWNSFSTFMNIQLEVGKEIFYSWLGIALSNVGYAIVQPVFKRKRRVAYKGLKLKEERPAAIPTVQRTKKIRSKIDAEDLQQWMEANYCEGGKVTSFRSKTFGYIIAVHVP